MGQKYNNYTEQEILNLAKNNFPDALDYILNKYKYLVMQKTRTLYLIGGERDDLVQEGMIGLYKAIQDYDFDKVGNTKFVYFAELCIARQLYNAIKASNRKKNIPLNQYVSFYTANTDESLMLEDSIPSLKLSPEEILIDKEQAKLMEQMIKEKLSNFENKVFSLFINGENYTDIAVKLKKEPKSIDNAIQRIKNKCLEVLKEDSCKK